MSILSWLMWQKPKIDKSIPPSLFVAADEPLIFYSGVKAAENDMEAIDVKNGIYREAYGPAGEVYRITTDANRVVILRDESQPNKPENLKKLLLNYFRAIGEHADPNTDLSVLIVRCKSHL